ncbi:MAG: DUF1553 domain-containing protein [Planctomyces sp.]|nr:DUF1553 domain-containing protein [Planctomyces sp.]
MILKSSPSAMLKQLRVWLTFLSLWAKMLCLLAAASSTAYATDENRKIDFNRDIRPILSDNCFTCHGPDEQQRVSNLRLDQRESAFTEHEGRHAVVSGDPDASELHRRVTSTDAEVRMPPEKSGRKLTESQIQLLREWIQQGAEWSEHWAFVAPKRHQPPLTQQKNWSRNPVDDFVLSRLEKEGWKPSDEAPRYALIRRVSLDLTGLPPTPEEVEAFLADQSPNAYETVVDRLLASPRYGEHMAVRWLDAARYADTSGYQNDGPRSMWRWRDWVIARFNANQPFDQFTIEQLAGDLLENPTLDQQIATGFNRNHRGNAEGGIIPEEYQVEYVVDRVDTTATVWLGLTMGCARCHDHKYDPIRQKEYYQVFAYFNNIPESGRAIKEGNSPPYVKAPSPEEQSCLEEFDGEISKLTAAWNDLQSELESAQNAWEANISLNSTPDQALPADGVPAANGTPVAHSVVTGSNVAVKDYTVTDQLLNHFEFDGNLRDRTRDVDAVFGMASPAYTVPSYTHGVQGSALKLTEGSLVEAGDTANFGYFDKFSISAWVKASAPNGTLISRMTPVEEGAGYYVHLRDGHIQVNLIKRWLDDAVRVESHEPIGLDQWRHIAVTYDGSRVASGIRVYLNGQPVVMDVKLDRINQSFAVATEPLRIGGGQSNFEGEVDDVRIYGRDLEASEVELLSVSQTVSQILTTAKEARTKAQNLKLTRYFLENQAPDEIRSIEHRLTALRRERRAFFENLPTVMVMQEMEQPRETHVLLRGQYDRPGEQVERSVPSVFPSMPADAPNNRLGFARWLVSPEHPLTARVAVNRFWQQFFGQGLVTTSEDFGAQGEAPSHPELLDWLATEFVRLGWDVKAMQRLIVTSAVYRQTSIVTPELQAADPDNRLLARGPRRRLPAETIRDQALFVSGLLSGKVGGPSVKPYQPEGLWQEIATDMDYVQSHGKDLYRRSLYTYWKRTVAPPTMVTLDATSREACVVQRSRTNTPLQALALMNDITFVEASRVFAQRVMAKFPNSTEDQIRYAFLTATARHPQPEELTVLKRRFDRSLAVFQMDPVAAKQFVQVGEFAVDESLNFPDLAAFTTVTSLILNLDEVLNQP